MDKAGIVNGRVFVFDDYQWLHGMFAAIITPIITLLLICHTYKFCVNYYTFRIHGKVSRMTSASVTNPKPVRVESPKSETFDRGTSESPKEGTTELSIQSTSESSQQTHEKESKLEFPKKKDNLGTVYYFIWIMHFLVLISLILGFLDCIFSIINYFRLNILNIIGKYCHLLTTVIVTCWLYSKYSLMFVSFFRVLGGFKNSIYEYNSVITYGLLVYFISVTLFSTIAVFFMGHGTTVYNDDKEYYWCQYSFSIYFVLIAGSLDVGMNTILLLMFLRPLIKLSKRINQKYSKGILDLMTKYFILTMCGIMSTSSFYVGSIFGLGSIQILDVGINLLCVVLMSPLHKKYYKIFCIKCHDSVLKACIKKINKSKPDNMPTV